MKNYKQIVLLLGITACSLEQEVSPVGASSGSAGAGADTTQSTGGNGGFGGEHSVGGALGGYGGNGGSTETGGSNAGGSYTGGSYNQGGSGGSEDCGNLLGKFATYSQGGWQHNAAGLIAGILNSGELLIGDKNAVYAGFTTVDAVTGFLPAGGTRTLQGQYTNSLLRLREF